MRRTIIRLAGGLGNQLFQMFAGLSCVDASGGYVELYVDSLGEYSAARGFSSAFAMSVFPNVRVGNFSPGERFIINARLPRALDGLTIGVGFASTSVGLKKLLRHAPDRIFLDGYFQDVSMPGYEANRLLLRSLMLKRGSVLRGRYFSSSERVVAIHVRRGDYVANAAAAKIFRTMDESYYREALSRIEGDFVVAVFSDDVGEAEKYAIRFGGISVAGLNMALMDELALFSACDCYVIGNSTYSWWGAYLGWEPGRRFIAPAEWFHIEAMNRNNRLLSLPFIETI